MAKDDVVGSSSITLSSGKYKIRAESGSFSIYYQLPNSSLISGHTYQFSFTLNSSQGFIENESGFGFGIYPNTDLHARDEEGVILPFSDMNKSSAKIIIFLLLLKTV